jgi:hypothetical protein
MRKLTYHKRKVVHVILSEEDGRGKLEANNEDQSSETVTRRG